MGGAQGVDHRLQAEAHRLVELLGRDPECGVVEIVEWRPGQAAGSGREGEPTRAARDEIVAFLTARLRPQTHGASASTTPATPLSHGANEP